MNLIVDGKDNLVSQILGTKLYNEKKSVLFKLKDYESGRISPFDALNTFLSKDVIPTVIEGKKQVLFDSFLYSEWVKTTKVQRNFASLILQPMGFFGIDCDLNNLDTRAEFKRDFRTFAYTGNEFVVDIEKAISEYEKELEKSPIYTAVKTFNGYGFYIGPVLKKPKELIKIKESFGHPVFYQEYISYLINNGNMEKLIETNDVGFVREKHPLSFILSNM